jgi:hypothetical protein
VAGTLALLKRLPFVFFRLKLTHVTWEDPQGEGKGRKNIRNRRFPEFPTGAYRR